MHITNEEDNKKYFNSKEYSTIFIKTEKEDENKDFSLMEILKENENNDRRKLLIDKLRNETGLLFLVDQIKKNDKHPDVNVLLAACWELAVDCSKHLSFFVDQAIEGGYMSVLEVITIAEEYIYQPVTAEEIETNILNIENHLKEEESPEKITLLKELIAVLKRQKVQSERA
jgi:hypothetical protein